ncbi:hypothetical protein [Phenylobacterium sp.]|uniref:hypothetical protein n=1 Tax=Phenylobacterium sp. TaxID=1871053 RepID=UPI0035B40D36
MAQDPSEDLKLQPLVAAGGGLSRPVLLAGVVGACALGVGAGLWARPHDDERRALQPRPAKVAEAPKTARTLEIVVDDGPAPVGAPIEVLPATTGRATAPILPSAPPAETVPMAPMRPPAGLVRVQAVEPIAVAAEPAPAPVRPAPKPAEPRKPEPRKPETARAEVRKAEVRKAEPSPAKAARAEKAKAKTPTEPARKVARAEPETRKAKPKTERKDRIAKTPAAKVAKARPKVETAKAPSRLSRALAKVAPKPAKDAAAKSQAKLAEARKARAEKARAEKPKTVKPKVEKAALKAKPAAAPAAKPKPKLPKPTPDNPIRKASNRCASSDPGAALVCADPALGAAERQLARAYRQAEAAGVSAAQLARQQQRWLTARAQAAREAPWAVRDVYEARIAELNDQTRDARGEY